MPKIRTESLDKSRDYNGKNAHTLRNGYTLQTAATSGSQASITNAAIVHNARPGTLFTKEDVLRWQEYENGEGRSNATMRDHLESLVGKGFLVAVMDWKYRVVPAAITAEDPL